MRVVRLPGQRLGIEPHRLRDPARRLFGRALKGGIVKVRIDCSRGQPPVPKQPPDGRQADAVHDALRGVRVAAVVDAEAGQSGLLADAAPEHLEAICREIVGKHPRRAIRPGK